MCERWSHSWFSSNSAFFYLQDPYRTVFSDRSSSDFLWTKLPFCPKKGRDTHLSVEHCGHTDGFVTALKYYVILLVCQCAVSPLAFSPTVTHQAITLTNDPQHPLSIATLIRFTKHCAIVLQFLPFLIFQIIYRSPPKQSHTHDLPFEPLGGNLTKMCENETGALWRCNTHSGRGSFMISLMV